MAGQGKANTRGRSLAGMGEEPKFESRITHVVRHEPVVYQIEVHEITMFKAADEINLLESKPPFPLSI